ncbi:YggT family protein [Derxia lacustris]|uniref:YggT family protein n=1 Tax=Derxia lacustris TaxID=764842 RepID=UPI000A177FF0|nr:YggT family protein [Derxia lacustris]
MLYEIFRLIIDTAGDILGGALLLRAYMQWVRLSPRNPVSSFVFALTNRIVLPLRRVLPGVGGIDWASIVAALLVALLVNLLLTLPIYGSVDPIGLVIAAVFGCVKWAAYLVFMLVIVHVILGWVNPHAPMAPAIDMLVAPLLGPIRRVLPSFGGIDFSPLVLLLVVQIVLMLVGRIMGAAIGVF